MTPSEIRIRPLLGLPEVVAGDDLAQLIETAAAVSGVRVRDGDVLVLAQKVVSKAEGRMVRLGDVAPSPKALDWARESGRDPRLTELVLREARQILRMDRGIIVAETRHGFICANAGVDTSNVPPGWALLLPEDPDRSADRIRGELSKRLRANLAVIISDTFGRPWREGLVNVALGVSGMSPFTDYRETMDSYGKTLRMTIIATADELAAAAELVMGKSCGIPVAVVSGVSHQPEVGSGKQLLRSSDRDLFR